MQEKLKRKEERKAARETGRQILLAAMLAGGAYAAVTDAPSA